MGLVSTQTLVHKVGEHREKRKFWRRWAHRAAVAMIFRDGEHGAEVLMIKRAEKAGDPWSGHMAFPGGRMETKDRHGLATAERETWEEIGVDLGDSAECVGRLSDIMTRPHRGKRPMVISPYVFRAEYSPEPEINVEVAEVIWVPLGFLLDRDNRQRMQWKKAGVSLNLPCYFYRERRIWGLSLMMLDELMGLVKQT